MVKVSLRRDPLGKLRELRCRGHAGFDSDGADLVCAGVGAVLGALAIGLTRVAEIPCKLEAAEGSFQLVLPAVMNPEQRDRADLLLETAVAALQDLERHYTGYVAIRWLKPATR